MTLINAKEKSDHYVFITVQFADELSFAFLCVTQIQHDEPARGHDSRARRGVVARLQRRAAHHEQRLRQHRPVLPRR